MEYFTTKHDEGVIGIACVLTTKDLLEHALLSDCDNDTDIGMRETRAQNILNGFKGWWGSKADNFVGLFE